MVDHDHVRTAVRSGLATAAEAEWASATNVAHRSTARSSQPENHRRAVRRPVVHQVVAALGEDRLGVELQAAVVRTGERVDVTGVRVGVDADAAGGQRPRRPARPTNVL